MPKVEELLDLIERRKIKRSEFITLLDSEEFEFRVLYEISKDSYY